MREPVDVGLSQVLQIAVAGNDAAHGGGRTYARLADGRLFGWGANATGLLGDGTNEMRMLPEPTSFGIASSPPVSGGAAGNRCSSE